MSVDFHSMKIKGMSNFLKMSLEDKTLGKYDLEILTGDFYLTWQSNPSISSFRTNVEATL